MKRCLIPVLLLFSVLLSGCVLPLQRVSPDPVVSTPDLVPTFNSADFAIPAPAKASEAAPLPSASLGAAAAPAQISEPRLAVFWYAMADARVFELREQFGPMLESSGIPCREYDAENDPYRQMDQIREAVAAGWNLFAVQLVSDGNTADAEEIIRLVDACPLVFFDRVPDTEALSAGQAQLPENVGIIRTEPSDIGRVQGRMAGEYLTEHFSLSDLNQNGQISYTLLLGDPEDPGELAFCSAALEAANSLLAAEGYRSLGFIDEENTIGFQSSPDKARTSASGTALIRSDLEYYNYSNSNMVELILASSDDMALGALTALQSAWCNLGDGTSVTIPLYGAGASSAARTAVGLGQMAGTVDCNAPGYAEAVLAAVRALAEGQSASEAFSALAASSEDFSYAGELPPVLRVLPRPFSA